LRDLGKSGSDPIPLEKGWRGGASQEPRIAIPLESGPTAARISPCHAPQAFWLTASKWQGASNGGAARMDDLRPPSRSPPCSSTQRKTGAAPF